MSLPQLSLVAPTAGAPACDPSTLETPAQRASRLMAEARAAADEQVQVLEDTLASVTALARAIAEGGEVYPVGVRDLCRRLADDASAKSQTLDALLQASHTAHRR